MIRLLIIDDHAIVRKGICSLLADFPDLEVVGEAQDGKEGLAQARELQPDVIILDISLPDRSGLEVLSELRQELADIAVLILSMHAEGQYAVPLLRAGAAGYVPKRGPTEDLVRAIRKVASGGKFVSPELAERLAFDIDPNATELPHKKLSRRELQVLLQMADGTSLTEIGISLGISVKTVSTYRRRILEKMGMRSTAEMLRYAFAHKLST